MLKDLDKHFIALNGSIKEHFRGDITETARYDAVYIRYQLKGYYLQMVLTAYAVGLTIKPASPKNKLSLTRKTAREFIIQNIYQFLCPKEKVKSLDMSGASKRAKELYEGQFFCAVGSRTKNYLFGGQVQWDCGGLMEKL